MNINFRRWIDFMAEILAAADVLGRAEVQAEQFEAVGMEFSINEAAAFAELPIADCRLPNFKIGNRKSEIANLAEILPEGVRPERAAEYIRSKIAMTKPAYLSLLARNRRQYQDYAFFISNTESVALIEAAQQAVARAIEEGTTQEDFRKFMEETYSRLGVTPLDPWHLETVFRTNIQSAYQAGRYQQLNDPEVRRVLPYWQYRAILDSRTRPAHRAMNGLIALADDPIWKIWYPPNGYNCRCTLSAVGRREAERRAQTSGQDLYSPASGRMPRVDGVAVGTPDAGFEENPIVHFERSIARRGIGDRG